MKYIYFLLSTLLAPFVWGQNNNVCLGDSVAICSGESVTLDVCSTADTNVVFLNNVNAVALGDDQFSGVVNIGFGFEFYGTVYNDCIISSNGYISFTTGGANGFSPWAINNAVPNPGNPTNSVMAPWQDYNPGAAGSGIVGSTTIGTAPNRQFVVVWKDQVMFGTQQSGCSALVLHETSNKIEVFLDEKPVVAWNGGAAIETTHNVNGTIADVVPGRNWPTQWVANLDGQEWVPDGPNSYTQNPIPYRAYVVGNAQTQWFDTEGNTYTSTTGDLTVTPNPTTADSIGYFINYSSCAVGQLLTSDTSWVYLYNVEDDYSQVTCPGGDDGSAWVEVTPEPTPGMNISYDWINAGNQTTDSISGLEAGSYDVEVDIDGGCVVTVTINVDEVPGTDVSLVSSEDVTCNSGNDGQAQVEVNQGTPPYSYNWQNSSSTSATATDLAAGTNTVEVTDANGCETTFDVDIDEPDPLSVAFLTPDQEACEGDSVLLTAQGAGGSSDYSYSWNVNGTSLDDGDSIWVTADQNNANYCVTVSESCGSPVADSCMSISFPEDIEPLISPDITGDCIPVPVNFDNITNAPDIDYSIWDYGTGDIDTIPGLNPGFYEYVYPGVYSLSVTVVTDAGCKFYTDFTNLINAYGYPTASFQINPNPVSLYTPIINAVNQSSSDAVTFEWYADGAEPNFSEELDQRFKYPYEEAEYPITLIAETQYGCTDTLTQTVRVIDEVVIFAPNAFTPDGDIHNENWRVYINNIDIYDFELQIFNRWGEVVFQSFNPEGSWDGRYGGRPVKDGTYIWKVSATDLETDEKYEFQGHVTILR